MFASRRMRTPSAVAAGRRRSAFAAGGRTSILAALRGARELVRRRIDDHLAGRAVDDDELAGLDDVARVVQADDGRHLERARQDRGVIRPAAGVGREAADLRPVDLRGQRRRQLVGDEHRRLVELAQQIARRRHALPQVHPQPADEVGDVALPLAQVRVGDLVEDGAELVEDLLDGPLGVDALLADDVGGARTRASGRRASAAARRRATPAPAAPARDARADVEQLLRASASRLVSSRCELVRPRALGAIG